MISRASSFSDREAACSKVAGLEKRIEELKEENQELKEKLALKDEKIKRLWRKLRRYDNPHTPPSRKLGSSKSKSGSSGSGGEQKKSAVGSWGERKDIKESRELTLNPRKQFLLRGRHVRTVERS